MICNLCPRHCHALRTETTGEGLCGMPTVPVLARASLHQWEEPCISGTGGAGTVFFSGCNLRCVFCQNKEISWEGTGQPVSVTRLREIYGELLQQGAETIDLVTPTHFTDAIIESLQDPLPVPVVWNSGGYESVETLKRLEGKVQVYLPDLKYALEAPAKRFSRAADYFPVATAAILEMFRQTGPCVWENGMLKRGVLIRHLMLPGQMENTRQVIDWVATTFPSDDVCFSLMSQYTPRADADGVLKRPITRSEYASACAYLENCGITNGYVQERTSANQAYTPAFDGTGV